MSSLFRLKNEIKTRGGLTFAVPRSCCAGMLRFEGSFIVMGVCVYRHHGEQRENACHVCVPCAVTGFSRSSLVEVENGGSRF